MASGVSSKTTLRASAGSMLDTGSLVGLLDSSANHGSAGTARESSLMDSGLLGTAMDTGRLQALVHQSHGMGEGVMGTHHLNTQHISSLGEPLHKSGGRDGHPPHQLVGEAQRNSHGRGGHGGHPPARRPTHQLPKWCSGIVIPVPCFIV